MAKIRSKFTKKNLDGYNKKKYVWKLLYCYMLGYDVEFGHMAAIQLITSNKFSEKTCGYMACTLLLNEKHELLTLICNSIQKDLEPNNEYAQCLALACVGNLGGMQFAESLATQVQTVLLNPGSRPAVRKKAALCLLRLFRKYPDCIPEDPDFPARLLPMLMENNLGVVLSIASLVLGLVAHNTENWEAAPGYAIDLLARLIFNPDIKSNYKYYLTICPWLQVKLFRLLQYYDPSMHNGNGASKDSKYTLNDILSEVLQKTVVTTNINKNNADHAILFEALNLIIHLCFHGQMALHGQAIGQLGRFVTIKEPNFRYLGLETMAHLSKISGTLTHIKRHQESIQFSLVDVDVSIRKRALDLLFSMCDKSNAREIVNNLLKYLQTCSYELREETVLKIAILAERFAVDLRWYLDVILQLISLAGDFVSDDIWFRVCQIVTNTEELQDYAATTCFRFLSNATVHENGVKVGAYILGEFGHQIKDKSVTGQRLFQALKAKFATSTSETRAIILSAYIKMANTYPELKQPVDAVFSAHRNVADTELQQRACEYFAMNNSEDESLMNMVFDVMPNFPERENLLLRRLKKAKKQVADRDVWDKDGRDKKDKKAKGDDDDSGSDSSDSEGNSSDSSSSSGSGSSSSGSGTEDDSNPSSFPARSEAMLTAMFKNNRGTLYDSNSLQVLCEYQVDGPSFQVVLHFCNKSSSSISNFAVQLPNASEFTVKIVSNPGPFSIESRQKMVQQQLWTTTKPFNAPPTIKLNFSFINEQHSVLLNLPLLPHLLVAASPMEIPDFINAWNVTKANEVIATRRLENPTPPSELKSFLEQTLHCTIMDGVDQNPLNFIASGCYCRALFPLFAGAGCLALYTRMYVSSKACMCLVAMVVITRAESYLLYVNQVCSPRQQAVRRF